MSQVHVTRRFAMAAAMSILPAFAASAQATHSFPAGSVTFPVHFPIGSAKLGSEDLDTIRGVASRMKGAPHLNATIIGKADTLGSAEYNEHLAENRSRAVFEALAYTNKVPETRVQIQWTGEHLPVVSTADQQAELQNRVVLIVLQ
jgi:OmpA-OmpF porin, OOP family